MALIDVTPKMISNTSPYPYVITASVNTTHLYYSAWNAFNKTLSNIYDAWLSGRGSWLQIDFNLQTRISAVRLSNRYGTITSALRSFYVQGSNNGTTFVTILNRTSEPKWVAAETRTYLLPQDVKYRYYRIYTVWPQDGGNDCIIGELRFLQEEASPSAMVKGIVYDTLRSAVQKYTTTYNSN